MSEKTQKNLPKNPEKPSVRRLDRPVQMLTPEEIQERCLKSPTMRRWMRAALAAQILSGYTARGMDCYGSMHMALVGADELMRFCEL